MAATFKCEIVTPVCQVYADEATFIAVPGANGELGVMYLHAPTISTLGQGEVRLKKDENGATERIAISGGYVEIDGTKVIILADRALKVSEINRANVDQTVNALESKLASFEKDDAQAVFIKKELAWNQLLQKLSA